MFLSLLRFYANGFYPLLDSLEATSEEVADLLSLLSSKGIILKTELLEYHIVLGQSACFVRKQHLNSTKLLGDRGAPSDSVWNLVVAVDLVRVVSFCHV